MSNCNLRNTYCAAIVTLAFTSLAAADEPWPTIARRIPPEGIAVSDVDRARAEEALREIVERLAAIQHGNSPLRTDASLADVEIYAKAVRLALLHNEFYKPQDIDFALAAIKTAKERLDLLEAGKQPWSEARGLVVRGYRSAIDGSAQPYGLVIPEKLDLGKPTKLYVWLHGRGDKSTDLHFIRERQASVGQIAPSDGIVLHPFGRHCIGFKSAGEIDVLDAIASVAERYNIDLDRVALMGFSMGGAGAWHLGAHYSEHWAAVHAGAGFAETQRYIKLVPDKFPPDYEQTLWRLYDVPNYARNLLNMPVLAYSGEDDPQMQAARVMEEAFREQGAELKHVIGPKMGHKYHPDSLKAVMQSVSAALDVGRNRHPARVLLQTRTLRYPRLHWVTALGLEEHWQDTRVDAERTSEQEIQASTRNVRRVRFDSPTADCKTFPAGFAITIDGQKLILPNQQPHIELVRQGDRWLFADLANKGELAKVPGLQGPIDDALMAPFLVVVPTGKSPHAAVNRWVNYELHHFRDRWRSLYRGELRVKNDVDVTQDDMAKYHLIVWGDPASNRVLADLTPMLPLRWGADTVELDGKSFAADSHLPILVYPNPRQPDKYVVLNSGPTHREAHDSTNAQQNPKLPDWAIVEITSPPTAETPGNVVAADFFDEKWKVKP